MAEKIDAEIERIAKLGQTPKRIEVGDDLYEELYEEQNPPLAASLVGEREAVPVYSEKEVIEYKGIRVVRVLNVPRDYLKLLT